MPIDQALELIKASAFQIYLEQWPNVNITAIANQLGRDRSRVSRWAQDGDWPTMAERLQQKAAREKLKGDEGEEGITVDLEGAKTFDEVLDLMSDRASEFIEGGSFRFSSPNEILRFLEMAEKHKERKEKEQAGEDQGAIIDSSLPEREADAIRAGFLLINAAKQLPNE